ncbi:BTB/POZ domain and ankyrin repeat-containing protein NPR1-like isoform X2 [Phalaenopsis equestris]|uniref:BTB/POZ domain and ankyrin repeat-containing protein NPR1-like isoform X2 n=1 Tax=Phalaenopsis equestris TaxID=78828 RepID=UPI0009E44DBA|nr:BTB/POZ domain and ankyrin repeat-containing protein NPR1-like isoform X2 [Phalaenopsis equestris]
MISTTQLPTFSDSENGSSIHCPDAVDPSSPDIESLRRLSDHLFSLRQTPDFDFFSDACIAVGPNELAVHRCLLSARSSFFRDLFSGKEKAPASPVRIDVKELVGDGFVVGFEALILVIDYLYSGRIGQLPKHVCMCADEECFHVGCRPAVRFMAEVLFASFTFKVSELISLFQRHLLDILDKIAIDEMPIILCVAKSCGTACERLLINCVDIVVKSDMDVVTLERTLPLDIVKQVMETRSSLGLQKGPALPDKHVRRIYRALDSDDIELVKLLLKEGHTSLDDACALHYAVAYCDTKITMDLLDYGHADVNHMNPRGYSLLHVAAARKEPKILMSLLTKGARPSDLTLDGRKAVQIAKRVTTYVDYYRTTADGRASLEEGRLCIGILEHAERRIPPVGQAFSLAMAGNDQHGILLYLENRGIYTSRRPTTDRQRCPDIIFSPFHDMLFHEPHFIKMEVLI